MKNQQFTTNSDHTMAEYYRTMREFLHVQERVMAAFLRGIDSRAQLPLFPMRSIAPPPPVPVVSVENSPARSSRALLMAAAPPVVVGENAILRKTIDLVSDPYLDEHRLDGRPVMPFAGAAEYIAEAAMIMDGRPVRALTDMRMLSGLVLREDTVDTELLMGPGEDGSSASIKIDLPAPPRRPAYRARAEFGAPRAPARSRLLATAIDDAPLDIDRVYREWLFHGLRFQTVREISVMSRERITAKVIATRPEAFYPPAEGQRWIFDPGVFDGVLQMIFAWGRWYRDAGCLPTAVGRLERFGEETLDGEYTIAIEMLAGWTDSLVKARIEVVDRDGLTRLSADDIEGWLDPQLKRLSSDRFRSAA